MENNIYKGSLTMDERLFIHCYYTTLSRREMAKYLQVSFGVIKTYLDKSNLRLTKKQIVAKNSRIHQLKNNSAQFDDFIRENYLRMNFNQLARACGKSDCFISNRIKFLKLHIPAEILQQRIESGQLKKGNVPPNKGKKLSKEQKDRMSHTFFKKGLIPHNAKANGEEIVRKDSKGNLYLMIKIPEKRKLEYKHRVLWEQHNGPIPKGYNVQFKDGNTLNCVIENLYLIDRSNQVKENFYKPEAVAKRFLKMNDEDIAYAKVHAPGLIEAKATQIKLKSILNKQQNEVKRSNRTV